MWSVYCIFLYWWQIRSLYQQGLAQNRLWANNTRSLLQSSSLEGTSRKDVKDDTETLVFMTAFHCTFQRMTEAHLT